MEDTEVTQFMKIKLDLWTLNSINLGITLLRATLIYSGGICSFMWWRANHKKNHKGLEMGRGQFQAEEV